MRRFLFITLFLISTSAHAQEVISEFSDKTLPVLNDELRRLEKTRGGKSFKTISTPSGSSVVADKVEDTLTLRAGSGIEITGRSTDDSVTLALTGSDTAPGGDDTNVQFNDGGSFGGNSGFIYKKVNRFVGIGTTAPITYLDARGSVNFANPSNGGTVNNARTGSLTNGLVSGSSAEMTVLGEANIVSGYVTGDSVVTINGKGNVFSGNLLALDGSFANNISINGNGNFMVVDSSESRGGVGGIINGDISIITDNLASTMDSFFSYSGKTGFLLSGFEALENYIYGVAGEDYSYSVNQQVGTNSVSFDLSGTCNGCPFSYFSEEQGGGFSGTVNGSFSTFSGFNQLASTGKYANFDSAFSDITPGNSIFAQYYYNRTSAAGFGLFSGDWSLSTVGSDVVANVSTKETRGDASFSGDNGILSWGIKNDGKMSFFGAGLLDATTSYSPRNESTDTALNIDFNGSGGLAAVDTNRNSTQVFGFVNTTFSVDGDYGNIDSEVSSTGNGNLFYLAMVGDAIVSVRGNGNSVGGYMNDGDLAVGTLSPTNTNGNLVHIYMNNPNSNIQIDGNGHTVLGASDRATGTGNNIVVSGIASTIIGYATQDSVMKAVGQAAMALGEGVQANGNNVITLGKNLATTNDSVFSVGFSNFTTTTPDLLVKDGKVGVNTSSPLWELQVVGKVSADSVTADTVRGTQMSADTVFAFTPTTGMALCLNSQHKLSVCTSAVGVGGACTCP